MSPLRKITLVALAVIGFALGTACSSSNEAAALPANCGPTVDVYAAIGGSTAIVSIADGEIWSAWRTDDGLIYIVRATKDGACILHIGREAGPLIPI